MRSYLSERKRYSFVIDNAGLGDKQPSNAAGLRLVLAYFTGRQPANAA